MICPIRSLRPVRMLLAAVALAMPVYLLGARIARGDGNPPPAAPAQAVPAPADSDPTFGAFDVLGATAKGKTLFIKLPAGQAFEAGITQTADELAKVLDARPVITGAFAKAQGRDKGGATFTAKLKGQDIKGSILWGAGPTGGSATVILASTDASKDDLAALVGFIPAVSKLATHKFPDGSGSIDLPEGWTTPDQTATYGIGVRGPEGQGVVWHNVMVLSDPDCSTIRMSRSTYQVQLGNYQRQMQMYQQRLAWHEKNPNIPLGPPPTPPKPLDPDPNVEYPFLNVCQYCDGAEDVLKYWYPIREAKQRRAGKGFVSLEKIIAVFPAEPNPFIRGSKSGIAYVAFADHYPDNTVKHARAVQLLETCPVLQGQSWQLFTTSLRAPDEIFDRDLPVMQAISNSVNLNMEVVNATIAKNGEAQRKFFAARFDAMVKRGQEFQDEQARRFYQHEAQIAAQEKARHDSASDFIEYIGGVRHVYDTATGNWHQVDLFNSHAIVDMENGLAQDPSRFIEIPLRNLR